MFNFRDSHTSLERSKDFATGFTVTTEGSVLAAVLEGGVEKVRLATTTDGVNTIVGFSKLDNESFGFDAKVEEVVVPSTAPYTVQLSHGLVTGTGPTTYDIRVTYNGTGWTQTNPPAATTQYQLTDATAGVVTFHSTDAGKTVLVYYHYQLTATEATQVMPGVRTINNQAAAQLSACTVMGGIGEVYTKEYDVTSNWTAPVTLKLAASGKLTTNGAGTDVSSVMQVIKVPDTADAHLGVRISTKL